MIVVTGAKGQLGQEVVQYLKEKNVNFQAFDARQLDITNEIQVDTVMTQLKPRVIFHCAAYTAVDKAEDVDRSVNISVNVDGTANVVNSAKKIGATFVYISTDYVFDGDSQVPYVENHHTNPQNQYGLAKQMGEKIVQEVLDDYYIIRTSWVFGQYGHNFVYTMLKLAKSNKQLAVIDDQIGRPTWTKTLAQFMFHLLDTQAPYGIYHLANDGECSWHQFAQAILKNSDVFVHPISSSKYPQKAKRPHYSVLDITKAKQTGFMIPTWEEALQLFLESLTYKEH